ncbi:MAG TPA: tetratricopeptide repeat protein [Pirellulales bacterium]|nr:tetratricopeptide repeat protein [Pirellulales bacterium]
MIRDCPVAQLRDPKRALVLALRCKELGHDSWDEVAEAQIVAGQYREALETCEKSSRAGRQTVIISHATAVAYWHLGRQAEARELVRQIVQQIDSQPNPYWYAAEYRWRARETAKLMGLEIDDLKADDPETALRSGIALYRKLVEERPDDPGLLKELTGRYTELGNLLVNTNRFEEAERTWTEAMERWPEHAAGWRSRAELYIRLGLFPEAAADFDRACRLEEPGDALGCLLHALLRVYEADGPGYRETCQRMLIRFADSTNPDDCSCIARALVISPEPGVEPSRAVALAEGAVADNKSPDRVAHLGLARYRTGEFERAVAALEESLTLDANFNPPDVHSTLAMALYRLGKKEQACGALDRARSVRQERLEAMLAHDVGFRPDVWSNWNVVFQELFYKEAYTLLHGCPPPDDPRLLVMRGRGLEAIGRTDEARAAFAQAFALAPESLLIRVQALPEMGRADAFAQRLSEVSAFTKEHLRQPLAAWLALAQLELRWGGRQAHAGQFQAAASAFAEAAAGFEKVIGELAANADSTTTAGVPATSKDIAWYRHELGYVLVYRGETLLNLGQLSEAEAAFRRGLEVHESLLEDADAPADTKSRLAWNQAGLARLHCDLGAGLANDRAADQARTHFRAAIAAYAKAIEVAPDNAVTHNDLAWLYATCPDLALRDPAQAVALAKKAVELQPTDGTGWNTLGVAHYRAGEWKAAVEALTKSMELRSRGDAFDWYFLAMAHQRLGELDEARRWQRRAVEWVEQNSTVLAANRQWRDEIRRFRTEAEDLLGQEQP